MADYGTLSPDEPAIHGLLVEKTEDASSTLSDGTNRPKHHLMGPFATYCFTVNYIIGVGVLGVPYAYVKAGYVLSPIVMAVTTLLALICAYWVPEVLFRAEKLAVADETRQPLLPDEASPLVTSISHQRKFEMNELVGMFLGPIARKFYEVCIILYLLGALWSYASVVSSSLSAHVPLPFLNDGNTCNIDKDDSEGCKHLYWVYISLFSVIALPLTCLELNEQKHVQIVLSLFRFVAMMVMTLTSLAAIGLYPNTDLHPTDYDSISGPPYFSDMPAVSFKGMVQLFPVCVYAQIFHHSIPGLTKPLREKELIQRIFAWVLLTTFVFYNLVGLSVGLYYGTSTSQTCSLNWAEYRGSRVPGESTPDWAIFISFLVVLFPPFDILSAYPLNAITLGNNLLVGLITDPGKLKDRRYITCFRLLAAVPPLVGAMFEAHLATILGYAGCVGILIAFVAPCALQYASIRTCKARFGATGHLTPYTTKLSESSALILAVGLLSIIGFVLVVSFEIVDS